jgi:hypothetical protein
MSYNLTNTTSSWKWATIFYELSLVFVFKSGIFYWIFVAPNLDPSAFAGNWFQRNRTHSIHTVPLVLYLIDFALNRVTIRQKHLAVVLMIDVFYGCVMALFVTQINGGKPLYPMMDF